MDRGEALAVKLTLSVAIALAVAVTATKASAQSCGVSPDCFCLIHATRVATGAVESIDGARTTLRIESASAGLDAGSLLSMPRQPGEALEARWFVVDDARYAVDDAGTVTCPGHSAPRVPVEVAERAVGGDACYDELLAAGLTGPPCPRTSCSVSPAVLPMMLLAWVLRRRRT